MATSQAEAELMERKLRPIYDAIDNGQNKKAVQMVDKILKKQDTMHCAKALKAIGLLRMGRSDESSTLIDEVIKSQCGDQATLQAVSMYHRETGDYKKIVELYSAAAVKYPTNGEILTQLFMAYVRIGDYQKQQQVAVTLQKIFPDNGPYYCWRVMSILMQAHDSTDRQKIYIPLAERLLQKYVEDNRIETEAEVRLYLIVLELVGKTEKRLEVVSGEIGKIIRNPLERASIELKCLVALQKWDEASKRLHELLQEYPDQWSYIREYVQVQLKRTLVAGKNGNCDREADCAKGNSVDVPTQPCCMPTESRDQLNGDGVASADDGVASAGDGQSKPLVQDGCRGACPLLEAMECIEQLKEKPLAHSHILRGPFLGRLELLKEVTKCGMDLNTGVDLGSAVPLLMDYFMVFSANSCCYDDLHIFLSAFPSAAVEQFLDLAEQFVKLPEVDLGCSEDSAKANLSNMRKSISLLQLQRHCGRHDKFTVDQKEALIAHCTKYFRVGVRLSSTSPSVAIQYTDFYGLLAAHLMVELYGELCDYSQLYRAVLLLEEARSFSVPIKMFLMKLYCFIGAMDACTELYEALAIKHVQVESLGFLPMRYMQAVGSFGFAGQFYRTALRFYYSCSKETTEYVIQAYKNGTFHKITEMIDFAERISCSLNFAYIIVDTHMMEFSTTIHSVDKAKEFFSKEWFSGLPYSTSKLGAYCDKLTDGRNLTIFDDWNPPHRKMKPEDVNASFDLECHWLRIRVNILQCLKQALNLLDVQPGAPQSKPQDHIGEAGDALEGRIKELSQISKLTRGLRGYELLKHREKNPLLPIQSPPPSLAYTFLENNLDQLVVQVLCALEQVARGASSVKDALQQAIEVAKSMRGRIKGVPEALRVAFEKVSQGDMDIQTEHPYKTLMHTHIDLEKYVLFMQVIGCVAMICGICVEFLGDGKKKKRKKKGQPKDMTALENELVEFLKELRQIVSESSQQFKPLPEFSQLSKRLNELHMKNPEIKAAVAVKDKQISATEAQTLSTCVEDGQKATESVDTSKTMFMTVCRSVLESYSDSFQALHEMVVAKTELINSTIKQLGGTLEPV